MGTYNKDLTCRIGNQDEFFRKCILDVMGLRTWVQKRRDYPYFSSGGWRYTRGREAPRRSSEKCRAINGGVFAVTRAEFHTMTPFRREFRLAFGLDFREAVIELPLPRVRFALLDSTASSTTIDSAIERCCSVFRTAFGAIDEVWIELRFHQWLRSPDPTDSIEGCYNYKAQVAVWRLQFHETIPAPRRLQTPAISNTFAGETLKPRCTGAAFLEYVGVFVGMVA